MLIFSIGPVQSLIAQARKTRDLWLGSYLLAKLMEAAMQGIDTKTLVFPVHPTVEKSIADLPNKYIALLDSGEDAKKVAELSIVDSRALWETVQGQVKARVFRGTHNQTVKDIQKSDEIWDRQTNFDRFFEVYWVAVPEPTDDEIKEEQARPGNAEKTHYQLWLEKAQTTFDARKRLHDFQQPPPELGEKSTISGEREALHGEGTSRQAVREYWRTLAGNHPVKDIYHDGTERLDAIDTIKRFALYAKDLQPKNPETQQLEKMDFPSTSSIATASFVKLLLKKLESEEQDTDLDNALENWLKLTKNGGLAEMQPHAIPYLYRLAGNNEKGLRGLTEIRYSGGGEQM
jgi:CRISPR-associated protein Cmr2